jgi:branched-chain amino acid transport system substrate-binding protein
MTGYFVNLLGAAGALILSAGIAADAAAQSPLKIGVIGPNSGPYAIIGEEVRNGIDLYVAEVGGQMAGRKVEVIYEDAQAKPDVGLTKVQKLVERDNVSFVAGIVSSSVAYAVRDYIVAKNVPLIITVASADGLTQKQAAPNIFRTNTSGSQASHPLGTWLYQQGYRRLVLIAPNYAMGYEQTGGFARTFVAAGGKIVKTLYPPLGAADFGPFLTSVEPKSADAIGAVFAGGEAIKFVKQYADYGMKGTMPLVGTGLLTDDLILKQEGEAAEGIITSAHYSTSLDTPANKAFVAAYEKRFKRSPTLYSEASYVGARVIHEALKVTKGNTSDTKAVQAAIRTVKFTAPRGNFRFDGMNSPIQDVYIFRVEKQGGRMVNKAIAKFPDVSQFYTWEPKEFMAMPGYSDIANTWVK